MSKNGRRSGHVLEFRFNFIAESKRGFGCLPVDDLQLREFLRDLIKVHPTFLILGKKGSYPGLVPGVLGIEFRCCRRCAVDLLIERGHPLTCALDDLIGRSRGRAGLLHRTDKLIERRRVSGSPLC